MHAHNHTRANNNNEKKGGVQNKSTSHSLSGEFYRVHQTPTNASILGG